MNVRWNGRVAVVGLVLWAVPAGLVLGPVPKSAHAAEIVGRPNVIDGDSLDFSGRRVRLHGIDAPELDQSCRAGGRTWPCGKEARWAAINRIHPHWATCVERGRAPDGATLAVCYLAGLGQHDLNAWLVAQGWALADRGAAPDYVEQEAEARAAGRGLWRGRFVPPWEWRQGKRLTP